MLAATASLLWTGKDSYFFAPLLPLITCAPFFFGKSIFSPYFKQKKYFIRWILFSVLVAANVLRLAGDHLMARMRARPQEEVNNVPEEPVAPQVHIYLNFSTNEESS